MNKETQQSPKKLATITAIGALEGALIGATIPPFGIPVGALIGGVTAYAAEPIVSTAAEYIQTVGWLAQMDPTYPHTEFHPYTPQEPMHEPFPELDLAAG